MESGTDATERKKRRYSTEADPTRAHILAAAIECISSTAASDLSVRRIAAAAGVNVSTVHYYFGTKDGVITEALKQFFAPLVGRLERLPNDGKPPQERLVEFLLQLIDQFHLNPGVFTSIMEAMIASNIRREAGAPSAHERVIIGVLQRGRERLLPLVRDVSGIRDRTLLIFRTMQVMTSIVHPMLISTVSLNEFGIDFRNPANRRRYVRLLVDSLANEAHR